MLQPGLDWLEARTGKPVIGVLPYVMDLHLEAEDGIDQRQIDKAAQVLKVVVPVLPRISNHTDFDPLRLHPQVDLQFVGPGQSIPAADLIILPGSKSVRSDLAYLRANGWDTAVARHLRYGGKVLGICGGLQMLGEQVHDPLGLEGLAGSSDGLGLLAFSTTLEQEKQLRNVRGRLVLKTPKSAVMKSMRGNLRRCLGSAAVLLDDGRSDGAQSPDGQILGTYLHGLFETPAACSALLRWAGLQDVQEVDYHGLRERDIERLADLVEHHLDTELLRKLCGIWTMFTRSDCGSWLARDSHVYLHNAVALNANHDAKRAALDLDLALLLISGAPSNHAGRNSPGIWGKPAGMLV